MSLILLASSYTVEHARVRDHLPDASGMRAAVLLVGCLVVAIALGTVFVYDVRGFVGETDEGDASGSDEDEAMPEPDLADVEKVRKTEPLEAIRILREYLNQNPGELHVMTRIAEIYETDMRNLLAAALEYEELLRHKMDRERWGRWAIHLTNLYIRLQQQEKAIALMRRIDRECGNTAAGAKARKHLQQVEGGDSGI